MEQKVKQKTNVEQEMQCHSPPTGLHVLQVLGGAKNAMEQKTNVDQNMQCHSPPTSLQLLQVLGGAGPQHIPQVEQFVASQPAVGGGEVAPLQRNNTMRQQ